MRHVFDSRDRVTVILGKAGTGKTTILQEIRDGLDGGGQTLRGYCPVGRRPAAACFATRRTSPPPTRRPGF